MAIYSRYFFRIGIILGLFALSNILITSVPIIFAEEMVVTEVKLDETGKNTIAEVVLNDQIKIKEIKVSKEKGILSVKFPEYVSGRGRVYPQVEILNKELSDRITKAIETNRPSDKKLSEVKYEIARFSPLSGNSARKVNVDVKFNNAVVVACGIIEGDNWKKIAWPSRKDEKRNIYINQVLVRKKLRKQIEKDIWTRYEEFKEEGGWEEDEW